MNWLDRLAWGLLYLFMSLFVLGVIASFLHIMGWLGFWMLVFFAPFAWAILYLDSTH